MVHGCRESDFGLFEVLSKQGDLVSKYRYLDIMGYIDTDFAAPRWIENLVQGTLYMLEEIWKVGGVRSKTWYHCLVYRLSIAPFTMIL